MKKFLVLLLGMLASPAYSQTTVTETTTTTTRTYEAPPVLLQPAPTVTVMPVPAPVIGYGVVRYRTIPLVPRARFRYYGYYGPVYPF